MKNHIKYLLIFTGMVWLLASCKQTPVNTIPKRIRTVRDIEPIDSSLVVPYDYKNVISLDDLPVAEKKQKFFDMLLPAVLVAKTDILYLQNKVKKLTGKDTASLSRKNKRFLKKLLKQYKAKSIKDLILKLDTHPTSIVLAQAAIESGWGTSRFFLEANNVFGIWSFSTKDDRIAAGSTRDGKVTYLKKYPTLSHCIEDYFLIIARGPYGKFRYERSVTNDPYRLIPYLDNYSELGETYVERLRKVISSNRLTRYDHYRINPRYVK